MLAEPAEQDDGPVLDEEEDGIPLLDEDYDVDPEFEPVLADAENVGGRE